MISFTPDLETRIPRIDNQHRELIRRINNVVALGDRASGRDESDRTIALLGSYIDDHFRDEEELQSKSGYPKFEWHREQHKVYVESFRRLKEDYEKNGPSFSFTFRLNKSIIEWIVKHIQQEDADFARFVRSKV